jgi:hypothetical protein
MGVRHFLLSVLAFDVVRDLIHRTGAVQRHHSRDVIHGRRLELLQVSAHARRLELKDTGRLAAREEFECFFVVRRNFGNVDFRKSHSETMKLWWKKRRQEISENDEVEHV